MKKGFTSIAKCVLLLCTVFALNACIGASADISIRADGSGTITLEYRIPHMLESLGRLDGNERWPIIPVGRADFERSLARVPGLRLRSFSSRENSAANGGRDIVIRAALDFSDTTALLAFLDITGSRVSLSRQGTASLLRLVLLDPSPQPINADLASLLREVSAGYEISVSLSAPGEASLAVIPPSVRAARLVPQGRKVSFAIATGDLFSLTNGLALEIQW